MKTASTSDDFGYANLAIRGRKLAPIVAEQVDAAIALEPDLITVHGGGNDVLRPRVDIDALAATYDAAVARLVATGARVVMFTAARRRNAGTTPAVLSVTRRLIVLNSQVTCALRLTAYTTRM